MTSPYKKEPNVVAEKVMKRAAVSQVFSLSLPTLLSPFTDHKPQMARKLQSRLALAQFKTHRGWEDLPLDRIEPKVEEELRRRRPMSSGDMLSDSSSSSTASEFQYPSSRTLMSSPLKSSTFFSDQIGSGGSTGHRKRLYHNNYEHASSGSGSSHKRFRSSPTAGREVESSHSSWRNPRRLAQSSPIKPRKQPHFTTSAGPELSFFRGSSQMQNGIRNFAATSDDEDDALPAHSFNIHSSPPRTPSPVRSRGSLRRSKDKNGKSGEEGADLLLFLATSPSPANPINRSRMQPPSTPPPKNLALPSSMMTTPGGGGGLFPQTPGQNFDFADFVNITPSPAQKPWKTPQIKTPGALRTPATISRRNLTFENFLPPGASPSMRNHSSKGLGMDLGGDLISR